MDPLSIGLALTAISTAVGVAGAVSQGNAAKQAADYNSQVATVNAQNATNEAQYNQDQTRQNLLRAYGAQGAAFGASGTSGGSSQYVSQDTLVSGETDILQQKYQGQIEANNQLDQAQLANAQASSASDSALFGAAGSFLTGAESGYKVYSQFNPSG